MRRIVICGGGVAGLECLQALRALVAGDAPHITLVTDSVRTLERQRSVAEALGLDRAPGRDVVTVAAEQDADLHMSRLAIVRCSSVELSNGMELPYDALVVATGARRLCTLPGTTTFRGLEDIAAIRAIRRQLLTGEIHSVAFALPTKSTWPLPLYNLALAMGAEIVAAGVTDAQLTVVTPEQTPLAVFGPEVADALGSLLAARGVALRAGVQPVRLREGRLLLSGGLALPAERVISLGEARGRTPAGLASDRGGFLRVDDHGSVRGCKDIFAAGDVTTRVPRQGGLAAQQADAVAEAIAARLGVAIDPQPYRPNLGRLLLAGDAPLILRTVPDAADAADENGRVDGALSYSASGSADECCRAAI